MPLPFIRSLRARLVLVVLVAAVPLLGFFVYTHGNLERLAEDEWREASAQAAEQVAAEYRRAVDETRARLAILAQVDDVRAGGEGCANLVDRLLVDMPLQTALGRVDTDGISRCMSPDPGEPLDLSDREYIRRALETGEPQFSGFQLGRLTGRPVMSLAHPILDDEGEVIGAVASGVELSRLDVPPAPGSRSDAVTVTVYDLSGRILARIPDAPEALGAPVPWEVPSDSVEGPERGVAEARDLDGQDRIFATRALLTEDGMPKGFVSVGFDPEVARAGVGRVFREHLAGLVLAGTALVVGIWLVLDFTFLRRLAPVMITARRLGDGDLSARTNLPKGSDEISVLAGTVDRMAANLQEFHQRGEEEAEVQIRERESRLSQLAESVDEVFWLLDPEDEEVLYVNSNYERVYGRSLTSLREDPASWLEAVHPEDRDEVSHRVARAVREPRELEFRVVHPDGDVRWVRYRSFPARDEHGEVYRVAAVARDVTERRRMEEILHQSGKLEAVGRLAGGVAHDFNNVLTVIRGHTQFLLETLDEDDAVRQDVAAIDDAAGRSEALTRQLLAFSRKQPLQPQAVDVNEVVEGLKGMLVRVLGEGIELKVELAPDLAPVRVDPNQLEQALINLTANARHAMREGGTLTVRTRSLSVDPDAASSEDALPPPGNYVRITVADTGAGMEEEVRRHAFEPFFTTKGVGEGTGLGLASVYGTVKQSGGFIQVSSEPGRGASFEIDLPVAGGRPEPRRTRLAPSGDGAAPDGQETILLVEDEEAVLRVVRSALERRGYRVLAATSGTEGRDLFLDHEDEVDLVLTDVVMPDVGGPEMVEELQNRRPGLAVLFMSGYPAMARRGMEVAGSRSQFIQKPFSPDELAVRVRELLD